MVYWVRCESETVRSTAAAQLGLVLVCRRSGTPDTHERRRGRGGGEEEGGRGGRGGCVHTHHFTVQVTLLVLIYLESLLHGRGWPSDYKGVDDQSIDRH